MYGSVRCRSGQFTVPDIRTGTRRTRLGYIFAARTYVTQQQQHASGVYVVVDLEALSSSHRTSHYYCTVVGNLINVSQIPISTSCAYAKALAAGAITGCSHVAGHQEVEEASFTGAVGGGQEAKGRPNGS